MKRRDFMKAVAVAPAGTLAGAEKESESFSGYVKKFGPTPSFPNGYYQYFPRRLVAQDDARLKLWGPNAHGCEIITTIHKDGLDVRFV